MGLPILTHPAHRGVWVVAALTHRGDAHQPPPEALVEAPVPDSALLREVDEAGEHQDAHGHEEDEQPELLVAVGEGVGDGLEAGGVSRQLEDPEHSQDSEHGDRLPDVLYVLLVLALRRGLQHDHSHEEREDGEQVDNVHEVL